MKTFKFVLIAVLFSVTSIFAQTGWKVDGSHSNIGFEVEHMVISTVEGEFTQFDGTIQTTGDDFTNAKIDFVIDVNSISTDNNDRDGHLKSDDFFNAEKFPQIKFVSKSMTQVEGNMWKLVGDFTMRDVTKEIELDVKFKGLVNDPWGNTRVGFAISGEVNRFDYNLKWNNLLETGGLVVGEEVALNIDLQLIKEAKTSSE
jgi:polyisoprenoid-binding protein YceI